MKRFLSALAVLALTVSQADAASGLGYTSRLAGESQTLVQPVALPPAAARKPMPAVSFEAPGMGRASLGAFRGRVVLLNLWATWCVPCVKEMPSLAALQQQLGGVKFQVVTVALERNGVKSAEDFFRRQKIAGLTAYADSTASLPGQLGLRGLPTTILVDRQGREVKRWEGEQNWQSPEVQKLLAEAIDEQ